MKRFTLYLTIVLILVSALFCSGVYATWIYMSNDVDGGSDVSIDFQDRYLVYITDAVWVTGDGTGSVVIKGYNATTLGSTVTLDSSKTTYATAKLTVYNSSSEVYAFNAVKYVSENYSNTDVVVEHPNIKHGDTVDAGAYINFNVVFSYKSGVTPSNYLLDSFLNFEFTPLDELPEEEVIAVSGALGQFKDILNGESISDSLAQLTDQMDDYNANDRHDDSYIGNVNGASDEDAVLLENLFQENLTLNIEGVETNVTILIKREDVDGDLTTGDADGREMTIYMTTSDLRQTGSWFRPASATVYVSVFTSDDDGENWYQIGDMYEGKATIKQYSGMPGGGSFDTDTWKSTDGKTISQLV